MDENASSLAAMLGAYRSGARQRGIAWDLSRDEFERLTQMPCHYCGTPSAPPHDGLRYGGKFAHSGVGRVDDAAGYAPGNCVPMCEFCTRAQKATGSLGAFMEYMHRLAAHQALKRVETPQDMFGPEA